MKKTFFTFTTAAMIMIALLLTGFQRAGNTENQAAVSTEYEWRSHVVICTNTKDIAKEIVNLIEHYGVHISILTKLEHVLNCCKCGNANPDFMCVRILYIIFDVGRLL